MDLRCDSKPSRIFLGWDSPLLPRAADHLCELMHQRSAAASSEDWICVLPTAQSRYRFNELMSQRLESTGQRLLPHLLTSGQIAEHLYQPQRPIAIEFEQTLAWSRVLKQQSPQSLRPLIPIVPEQDAVEPWLELAGMLRRLANDLASHAVSLVEVRQASEIESEVQRWELLERLHALYVQELEAAGLADLEDQRRAAIAENRVHCNRTIVLIGVADLNQSVANVLAAVDTQLISIIAAPPNQKNGFDSLGRINPALFANLDLSLQDAHLIPADDIADQVDAATECVNEFAESTPACDIVLGTTDASQVALAELELESSGVSTHRNLGWTVSSTSIGRLFDLAAQLIARPTWRSLAALVRHSDVQWYLQQRLMPTESMETPSGLQQRSPAAEPGADLFAESPSPATAPSAESREIASSSTCFPQTDGSAVDAQETDLLVQLDQFLANHFPRELADPIPQVAANRYPLAQALRSTVMELFSDFHASGNQRRPHLPIANWCSCLLRWLEALYPERRLQALGDHHRDLTLAGLGAVRELLARFEQLNQSLDQSVSATSAFETISSRIAELRVVKDAQSNEVQITGWLDLALSDASAMIVIGLNHPFVPSSVTSDPFLPGSLRSQLRIADNEQRYARDLYILNLLLRSRDKVRLIVGKKSADGSPTPPSRLLANTPSDSIPGRVQWLLEGKRKPSSTLAECSTGATQSQSIPDYSRLPIPSIVVDACPVKTMSVTAFKSYLECPYRFYLRHVLKLKPIDDQSRELAANQFGDLVHAAVERFGESESRHEAEESQIYEALRHHLNEYAETQFGDRVESAVRLQIRQAERRLRFVATGQAARVAQGWTIHATEEAVNEDSGARVAVGERSIGLRGRFDRIDHHPQSGRWAILDYKTHGHPPEKKHLRKNRQTGQMEWIDLQLPLYRMMVPYLNLDADPNEVELGYFNVSDNEDETKINIADFSPELLCQAEQLIHNCVERILNCDFAPTDQRVQFDDYAMILQTGVASRMLSAAAEFDEGEFS